MCIQIDNLSESDIISFTNKKADKVLIYIGKIDIEKYKCITDDIQTDDVIITEERIQHIKERHPNDYEKYYKYMREIIESPEYIIEAINRILL